MLNPVLIPFLVSMATDSYFDCYPNDVAQAVEIAVINKGVIEKLNKYLTPEQALMAMCIVAPELSRYAPYIDATETHALKVLYVQGEISNFSIGPFQMKPTFAETIESIVANDDLLLKKYERLLIKKGSAREIRYERTLRLSNLDWQIVYLSAFVDIVQERTSAQPFTNNIERLKYWATLYNAGVNTNLEDIPSLLKVASFPRFGRHRFNYAEVCAEFFTYDHYCPFLRQPPD